MIKISKFETPLGEMIAGATDEGLCLLEFSDPELNKSGFKDIIRLPDYNIEEGTNNHLNITKNELFEYFAGERKQFSVSLIYHGTKFQQLVWNKLLEIPFGETRSYQEQSDLLNKPESIRAVANANGQNKIAIIIPCHRVIGSDGRLTGYAGGLIRKKWLLDHEKKHSGKATELELFIDNIEY